MVVSPGPNAEQAEKQAQDQGSAPAALRVLVLDDEKALLPLLDRYLRKLGHHTACFSEPVGALEAFRQAVPRFDLVMTDLTLEGISGEEVTRRVLADDPCVRVVVMSGYPFSTDTFAAGDRPRVTFLQKPFLPAQFQEAVARLTAKEVSVVPEVSLPVAPPADTRAPESLAPESLAPETPAPLTPAPEMPAINAEPVAAHSARERAGKEEAPAESQLEVDPDSGATAIESADCSRSAKFSPDSDQS